MIRRMLSKDGKAASILAAFVSLIALLNCPRAEAGSPVARWVADDWTGGTANWVDRVGGKTATSYGSPVKATTQFGGSASSSGIVFDGVDDYFEVTAAINPIAGQKKVTIVALFKATQGATGIDVNHWNYPGPINAESGGNPNDFGLTIGTDGLARAFFNGAISPSTPVSVVDGAVHTMILTWSDTDGGGDKTARFYVDGVLKGSLETDGGSGIVSDLIRFGRERETPTRWFRGTIGELRFYTTIEDPAAVHASMSGVTMNAAPTLTTVSTLTGGTEDTALTISYATLAAAANEADVDGDPLSFRIEAVSSGTLTKNGAAVTAGTTLLPSGESLVWTPAANAHGTLNTFTVKAWDGTLASASAVQVAVEISAVNDAPMIVAGAALEYTEGVRVVVESGGSALTLNGTSQYLLAGTASDHALTTGTIECWIKTGDAGWDYRGIIVKQMAFGLFLKYNQLVAYDWKDAREISTGRGLNDNAWHHVAMSFQSGVTGGTVIYLDGVAVLKTTYTVKENSVALVAGSGFDKGGQFFTGMIDEIRIWNSVRSAEEIANNKNSSVAANSPGLISCFKLDETSGGIALNTVSSGANGTVFGGATWTALSPSAITPSLSISDIDDTVIATGASVSIASGYSEGDILSVPANSLLGGVSANYNDGVLTFSGTASVNDYTAMLQAVGYNTTSRHPTSVSSTRSILYSVTDINVSKAANGTQTSTATSTVTIKAVNDAPVANSQAVTTDEDIAKAIVLSASDAEGAALTYIVTSQPTKGVLSGQAPSLTYTPSANINGSDLFTFKVNDGLADSDEVTVSITVNALNDAPSLVTPPVISLVDTVANDAFLVQTGTLVGADVDSNTLVYGTLNGTVVNGVATKVGTYGTLTVTVSTGDYTFTPNASAINALSSGASESYTVTVSDNGGLSATANLGVGITGMNDAPLLSASQGPTQATEQVAVVVDSGITVSDADNTTLASATVAVSGGYQSGEDVLGYVNNPQAHGNISGSFNASTGVLTLTSVGTTATLAQWHEALRSVTYLNTSDVPNTSARTVTVMVNDGALASPVVTKTVSPTAVPDVVSVEGLTAASKVYDGTRVASVTGTPLLVGVPAGADVRLQGTPVFTLAQAAVGTTVTIQVSGLTLVGAQAADYTLVLPQLVSDITRKPISINGLSGVTKVYDGTTTAGAVTVGTLTGLVGSETLTVTGTAAAYTSAAVGTYTGVAVTYTLADGGSGNTAGLASNYSLAAGSASGTITGRALTVTSAVVTSKAYDGTTVATITGTLSGVLNTEAVTLVGTGTFASKNVGANQVVTSTSTLSGSTAGNYTLTQPTGLTGTITAKALSIGAPTIASKVYDGTIAAGAVTVGALSGLVDPEILTVTGTAAAYTSAAVGTYTGVAVTYTLADGGSGNTAGLASNYSLAAGSASGTITGRALTVTSAVVTSKAYDGTTVATITGTLSGVLNTEAVTLVGTGTFASKNVGANQVVTSTSTLSGSTAGNYTLTQPTGLTGTITAKALSIGAPTIASKVYDGTPAAGTVTVGALSGTVSPETLIVSGRATAYSSAAVGTYSGVVVTYTLANSGSGTTAGLASNYSLAAGSAMGTITPAALQIIVDPLSLTQDYDGKFHVILWSTQPAGISVEVLYNGSTTAPQAAGIYEVKLSSVDPNFSGSLTVNLTLRKTVEGIALIGGVVAAGLQPVSDPSARYFLQATLGQPIAGSMVVVSGIQLSSGFWFTDRFAQALNLGNVQIPTAEVADKGIVTLQASASRSSVSSTSQTPIPQVASSLRLTETRMTVVQVPHLLRVRIMISGIPGERWKIQSLDGLHSENWQDADLLELDSNGTGSIETDAGTDSGVRFYRLVQP